MFYEQIKDILFVHLKSQRKGFIWGKDNVGTWRQFLECKNKLSLASYETYISDVFVWQSTTFCQTCNTKFILENIVANSFYRGKCSIDNWEMAPDVG